MFLLLLLLRRHIPWCDISHRSSKPKNRPSFRQIQTHLEIAAPDWLNTEPSEFWELQKHWKAEVREKLADIKSDGSAGPAREEEMVNRRREELRWASGFKVRELGWGSLPGFPAILASLLFLSFLPSPIFFIS